MSARSCSTYYLLLTTYYLLLTTYYRLRERSLVLYVRGCQLADGSGSAPPDTEFLDGEALNEDDEPDDENAPGAMAASGLAGAASSAASSASAVASYAASAVKGRFTATLEAPASYEQHQCISLTVERPGPLHVAVQEGRAECVRALISAASGGHRSSRDWAAAPSAVAATDLAFNLALDAVRDAKVR